VVGSIKIPEILGAADDTVPCNVLNVFALILKASFVNLTADRATDLDVVVTLVVLVAGAARADATAEQLIPVYEIALAELEYVFLYGLFVTNENAAVPAV
jgi:hypothetical protein